MRIEFPHSTRTGFQWNQALLRIGSDTGNDLILGTSQAAPHHLQVRLDRRGWVLEVLPDTTRIYVNARPVRERALLRPGDILSAGDCRMLLCADEAPAERAGPQTPERERCTVALRAVAGPLSGQVLSLDERLELGPSGRMPLDLPQGEAASLLIFWRDGRLCLETSQASESRYPVRVNGATVTQTVLLPGDQIGIGMHRFLIDAPGLEPEPEIVMPEPPPESLPEDTAGPRGEVWWLIATAAVLALGIALMLLMHS
ncbi:FHA domain-containing protein [Dyella acidiphila]|uniref:FHA domain-containing protein n=1 Tax=Dyella acidiphila TaxID=2775866 RepID=A0ABR9GAB1_9GAMM|nr:FHA domain-containing protein [Dyella acidiphila]MBE1161008.1 FHA domain-containing protein [Dyella acidiphila]